MANRWGEKMEKVTDFIFLGSKITVDGDCNNEIKRHLLLGRKAMMNLDSILKSRDITLLTKVHIVKAMFFSSSHIWKWELDHKEGWVRTCLLFSYSFMSNSLWPHGLQHVWPPCPSPFPRAHSNLRQLSWCCHSTISSTVIPFLSCLQSF